MTKDQQIKNIITFLSIIFGEDADFTKQLMEFTPDYLIEKFIRYIKSDIYEADWGLHPSLRRNILNRYCEKYKIEITDDL